MTTVEECGLNRPAVLWAFSKYDSHGEPKVVAGVEIMTNWEKSRRQLMGDDDAPIATDAIVMVDRVIAEGSIMRLGELADVPTPPDNLYEVVASDEVGDVKGREFQRNVTLQRWKKPMPVIVS